MKIVVTGSTYPFLFGKTFDAIETNDNSVVIIFNTDQYILNVEEFDFLMDLEKFKKVLHTIPYYGAKYTRFRDTKNPHFIEHFPTQKIRNILDPNFSTDKLREIIEPIKYIELTEYSLDFTTASGKDSIELDSLIISDIKWAEKIPYILCWKQGNVETKVFIGLSPEKVNKLFN